MPVQIRPAGSVRLEVLGPVLAVAAVLVLVACSTGVGETAAGSGAPAGGDGLVVVAELAPIADLVGEVLGDRGTVHALIPQGADAHTHEPRPSDVRRVTGADAFFGVGLGLNRGALRLVERNLPAGAPVVLLAELALSDDDHAYEAFDHSHDHADTTHSHHHADTSHSHDGADTRHSHGPTAPNPHVWVNPAHAAAMVDTIRDELVALDPGGADTYRANAADLRVRIEELDDAIATAAGTIPAEARKLVVHHDAWVHFGPRYGLDVIAAVQPADLSEPSAGDVRRIIDQIRAETVPTVFGSAEFPSGVLRAIAEETGATYGTELSDDALPGRPGDPEHSYVGLMQRNARAIVTGLGGDPAALDALGPGGRA